MFFFCFSEYRTRFFLNSQNWTHRFIFILFIPLSGLFSVKQQKTPSTAYTKFSWKIHTPHKHNNNVLCLFYQIISWSDDSMVRATPLFLRRCCLICLFRKKFFSHSLSVCFYVFSLWMLQSMDVSMRCFSITIWIRSFILSILDVVRGFFINENWQVFPCPIRQNLYFFPSH